MIDDVGFRLVRPRFGRKSRATQALATPQPSGSCEGDLSVALDAVVTFNPNLITVKSTVSGTTVKTEAFVEGWVRASVEALGEGRRHLLI